MEAKARTHGHDTPVGLPLRVCFVAGRAMLGLLGVPGYRHGGAELQMFLVGRELARDPRFTVSLWFYDAKDCGAVQAPWAETPTLPSLIERGLPMLSRAINSARAGEALRKADADVFVQAGASGITGMVARHVRDLRGRFVFWMASDGDLSGLGAHTAHSRRLYLSGLQAADAVLALTRHQQAELLRQHGRDSELMPVSFPMPDAPPAVVKDTVLWVASSQDLKQPWLFVDLAREFPDESFTMIMPRNDGKLWERIAGDAHGVGNLRLLERVPHGAIQAFFDRAKVFVNTSTIEGFPNTFVQAGMGAAPVLSLNISPDDVLQTEGWGRVAGGDISRLAEDLRELLADDSLRERMGRAGFEYAKREHNLDAAVERFKHVLLRVYADTERQT